MKNTKYNAERYNPYLNNTDLLRKSQGYKVAGYLRLSVEDGDKDVSDSIVSQKGIIENKVKELGDDFELIDFYIDDGYTGLNTNRPSFQKMLKDVEDGLINTIITKDLSRLSRNSFEANYYIEIYFLERNIRYISILDNVDTSIKSSNNDMIQFKTLINDWYSKDISKKVRSGVWARKEKGMFLGAKAPYGYKKCKTNKNKLEIDTEQANVVKTIFDMYETGSSTSQIEKYLTGQKIYCPSYYDYGGARNGDYNWRAGYIAKMLKNQFYIGHTQYGKRINLSYKSKKVKNIPREEWKVAENTHEPIISLEQFERVQNKLNLKKKTRRVKHDWFLNGLVICSECGSKMALKVTYKRSHCSEESSKLVTEGGQGEDWRNNKDDSIKCKKIHCGNAVRKTKTSECSRGYKGINEDVINEIVLSNIENNLRRINKNRLEEIIFKQYEASSTKVFDDNIKILEKQLEKVDKLIAALYEDYRNEILDSEDYKRFYKSETEKRVNIKNTINNLIKEKNNRPILTKEKLLSIIDDLSNIKNWDKDKISEIVYDIRIDKDDKIYINYRYDILSQVAV